MNGKSHVFVRSIRTASVILTVLFRRNACVKHRVAAWAFVFVGEKKSGAQNKKQEVLVKEEEKGNKRGRGRTKGMGG